MQIKKITQKLQFEVEVQDKCPHGKIRFSESCSSDCAEHTYGEYGSYMYYKGYAEVCPRFTTYTCATMHKW